MFTALAQYENEMGRFLKDSGKNDKTRVGKMMIAVGKSMSYSGQQRIALRFAGTSVSSSCLVLVTIDSAELTVNCEKMVLGSMLPNELVKHFNST
ncbi:hypothetical protein M8J77_011864 [Diaphorina citri]|nr:hypothetical protein M8J77_011864 [Diaphorina citri]